MSKITIVFDSTEDIQQFLNIIKDYPYDMDLAKGSIIVDAKSILGIMSLGIQNKITLNVHADCCNDLEKDIKQFIAA